MLVVEGYIEPAVAAKCKPTGGCRDPEMQLLHTCKSIQNINIVSYSCAAVSTYNGIVYYKEVLRVAGLGFAHP